MDTTSTKKRELSFNVSSRNFSPVFTKIEGASGDSLSSKLDGCETAINENGKIVCGRQIEPISSEFIKGLFNK